MRALIVRAILANELFKSLDQEQLNGIADAMHRVEVPVSETVMRQGDVADRFYVVESGAFDIFVAKVRGAVGSMCVTSLHRIAFAPCKQKSQIPSHTCLISVILDWLGWC